MFTAIARNVSDEPDGLNGEVEGLSVAGVGGKGFIDDFADEIKDSGVDGFGDMGGISTADINETPNSTVFQVEIGGSFDDFSQLVQDLIADDIVNEFFHTLGIEVGLDQEGLQGGNSV